MEVLRLLKTNPKLVHTSEEGPVDLTTSGKIYHTSYLQQISYPHLRFHSREAQQIEEAESTNFTYKENAVPEDVKEFKENKFVDKVKRESHSLNEPNGNSKKRRMMQNSNVDVQPSKRQKLDSSYSNHNIKEKFLYGSSLKNESNAEKDFKSSPFQAYNGQYFPFSFLDHSSLLERIKDTELSNVSPSYVRETESLLAAVQHSQMLYYSYCTKLLQNLQARRIIEEQEHHSRNLQENSSQIREKKRHQHETLGGEAKKTLKTKLNHSPNVKKSFLEENITPPSCSSVRLSLKPSQTSTPSRTCTSPLSPSSISQPSTTTNEKDIDASPSTDEIKNIQSRKRAPRALTGKHVRQGTGASPSTLQTLRQKLEQRQKFLREQSVTTDEESTSVGE